MISTGSQFSKVLLSLLRGRSVGWIAVLRRATAGIILLMLCISRRWVNYSPVVKLRKMPVKL
jgi:hypothetical protein